MSKLKIALIAGGVVSLLLVIATGVMTVSGMRKASETRGQMRSNENALAAYFKKNPFPSEGNIEIERKNLEVIRERHDKLLAAMTKGAVGIDKGFTPGAFSTKCNETVNRLRRGAPRGDGTTPVVDPGFFFGFERYDQSSGSGVPAEQQHVDRLMRQLTMMEMLVKELYASDVLRLESALREEFDVEGGAADGGRSSRRRGARIGGYSQEGFSFALESDPHEQGAVELGRERFGFIFQAREASLIDFLNRINAMWPYAQVSALRFVKNGEDVVFPSSAGAQTKPAAQADGIKEPPKPRTSRIISGALREVPIKVGVQIDVYSFAEAGGGASAGEDGQGGSTEIGNPY